MTELAHAGHWLPQLLYLVPVGSHIARDPYRMGIETLIYAPFAAMALADLCYHRCRARRSR